MLRLLHIALERLWSNFGAVDIPVRIDGNTLGRWEVAVIGKNLTDKITKGFENDIIGHAGGFYAHVYPGRSLALQGTVRF